MNIRNTVAKFSVSIPAELANFLEDYQKEHKLSSRSEVISISLEKLREAELGKAYREHAKDWQSDSDQAFWDSAAADDGISTDESGW
jgi:Arc/MetJ-type ribon-helix-helix transcriptional regulator